MPEGTVEAIRRRLRQALEPSLLEVVDESALHAGHPGAQSGGGHYRVRVVSGRFAGQARVTRHRLVYDALGDLMKRDIHALALELSTPDE
jgi:BolA protein